MTNAVNTAIEETIADVTSPKKFDLADVLAKKVKYPTRDVTVYLDGEAGQKIIDLSEEFNDNEELIQFHTDQNTGITEPEEIAPLQEANEKLKAQIQEIGEALLETRLVFTMRGVPPKIGRTITSKWRNEVRPDKNDDDFSTNEKNIRRNEGVYIDMVRFGTVKITDADGAEFEGMPPFEQVRDLYDVLHENEWAKLRDNAEGLSYAENLFESAEASPTASADFLPNPSAGPSIVDTSEA